MFFLFAALSTIAYALQGTLMVHFFRKYDPLRVTAIRGLCLGISMAPLLGWVDNYSSWHNTQFYALVLTAGLLTALAVWAGGMALHYLPVGVTITIQQSFTIVFVSLLELLFLGDSLRFSQYALIALLILINATISLSQARSSRHRSGKAWPGICLAISFAFCLSISFLLLTQASRSTNPYATAYMWELSIGLWATLFFFIKCKIKREQPPSIHLTTRAGILMASSPTLIGTGLYMFCVTMGPASLVNAVNSTQILGCMALSSVLYQEKLHRKQIIGIVLATAVVIALSLAS